jgi:hypothetical protein
MSQVKHKARDSPVSTRTAAGPEDVGEQTLMRGLDSAFPFYPADPGNPRRYRVSRLFQGGTYGLSNRCNGGDRRLQQARRYLGPPLPD